MRSVITAEKINRTFFQVKKQQLGQEWWLMPVIPTCWEAETVDHKVRSSRPA